MKKQVKIIIGGILIVILALTFFRYQNEIKSIIAEKSEKGTPTAAVGEMIKMDTFQYKVLKMEVTDDLRHFSNIKDKNMDTTPPIQQDRAGKVTNGLKILSVQMEVTNNSEEKEVPGNPFVLQDEKGNTISEPQLLSNKDDYKNSQYFHLNIAPGKSETVWVALPIKQDIFNEKGQNLYFSFNPQDTEHSRRVLVEFKKLQ